MKNLILLMLLLTLSSGCHRFIPDPGPGQEQEIKIRLYDEDEKEISEAPGGTIIKMRSEYFKILNQKYGDLQKEGSIIIDNEELKLLDAEGTFVTFALPYLSEKIRDLILNFRYRDYFFRLTCGGQPCLLYLPTVEGIVFAGATDGDVDGTFQMPAELTTDAEGNLYVIDQRDEHDAIIKVNLDGSTSLFAGGAGEFGRLVGIDIDHSRDLLYVADATSQQVMAINIATPSSMTVLAGSGAVGNADGTGTAASFHFGDQRVDNFSTNEQGQGLAIDHLGNLYVGEIFDESTQSSQLRKITPTGVVTTVTGSRIEPMAMDEVILPAGLTVGPETDLYYTGGPSSLFQGIIKVSSGTNRIFAGQVNSEELNDGIGSSAKFSFPKAIDYYENYFYVADGTNGALRRVSLDGEVITLAGAGHFHTPTWCACGLSETPENGSYIFPSPVQYATNPDIFEERAGSILMDQVGGVAKHNSFIYVSDYGYKVIWRIRSR